jgi:Glycosyl transferase family 64 domain
MAAVTARVRRNVSTEHDHDGSSPSPPSSSTTTMEPLSDKMLKVQQREREQTNWLYGLFCLLLCLAVGCAHFLILAATAIEREPSVRLVTTRRSTSSRSSSQRPPSGGDLLERARAHYEQCRSKKDDQFDRRTVIPYRNHSLPALPAFGVLDDFPPMMISSTTPAFRHHPGRTTTCTLPPVTACDQTKLTVIFLAYNPDRLEKMYSEMKKLLSYTEFVAELVLVWNGERDIHESIEYGQKVESIARIVYPIRDHGLPNDLLNRYHPQVLGALRTDCLLYYDDDGPFYSKEAIQSAFELWKRNSRHQIGAMARHIRSSAQPVKPKDADDTLFTPYCANDTVSYEFRFFANYDAHMVLPSGSLFHRDYLCYIWHDSMTTIRQFVFNHPVHPDDMTVSMLISQLAGVAPKVYSRRLRSPEKPKLTTTAVSAKQQKKTRRLMEKEEEESKAERVEDGLVAYGNPADAAVASENDYEDHLYHQYTMRRRLAAAAAGMGGVCWDCGSGMTEQKEIWAYLRTEAIASLVRYFGSLSTGSIGWCSVDSPYYRYDRDGRCVPDMAEIGSLPWMKPDGSPKDVCP